MPKNYTHQAVGIFEADNLVACYVGLDAAAKTADVTIQNVERNRLSAGACVKMRGSVSDVTAAMEVAIRKAGEYGKVTSHTVIASPSEETEPVFYMTANK